MKPGGYRASRADKAYVLQKAGTTTVTPAEGTEPRNDEGWYFPGIESGVT